MSKKVVVLPGQSLFDLALQEYGSVDGVFDLIERNKLNGPTDNVYPKEELELSDEKTAPRIHRYLSTFDLGTLEERADGIGWMQVERDFVVSAE